MPSKTELTVSIVICLKQICCEKSTNIKQQVSRKPKGRKGFNKMGKNESIISN